ncbi:MAG: capsule biosynthesis protein, partial [Algoriphagus sp. 32-45-6]
MILNKRFWYFFALICTLSTLSPSTFAQQNIDITSIKVDELSDEQISELVKRANEAGLSTTEFLQMAQMRGMSPLEIEKLRNRLEEIDLGAVSSRSGSVSKRNPRRQVDLSDITRGLATSQEEFEVTESQIFGSNLFYQKNRRLSFEPNLNQATPKTYILGPGDMVFVDIYGQSEKYYEATVNPDGFVLLDNIGPVSVSGKTIEEATGIIKSRVSRFYPGLSGANPNT